MNIDNTNELNGGSSHSSSPDGMMDTDKVGSRPSLLNSKSVHKSMKVQCIEEPEKNKLKRKISDDFSSTEDIEEDESNNFGKKMGKMLKMFGSEVTKNLHSKKKRMDHFLGGAITANQTKVADVWKSQSENQKLLIKEMQVDIASAMNQWKTDMVNMQEREEKTTKNYTNLIISNQQTRTIMLERFNAVHQAQDRFFKTLEEQETKNKQECDNMQNDMKKELCALQKKMIKEGERQEAENMKKSLQAMLLK